MESSNQYVQTNTSSRNNNCCDAEKMKYDCGLCAPFLEGSEEVSVQENKNLISEPNDIVKVESLVASLSKLDCIVEEKKEEELDAANGETRDVPVDDSEVEPELENDGKVEATENVDTNTDKVMETIPEVKEVVAEITEVAPEATTAEPVVVDNTPDAVEEPIIDNSLECDFDTNPSDLYLCLMRKDWSGTIRRCVQRPDEAKMWIYRKESTGALRWRLLPIHAGIIFNAPVPVIDALLHAHLYGADCKDDQGMIPLHLAIRMNSDHTIVEKLVSARPNSVNAQDRKGRTPRALAEKLPACPQKLLVIQTLENVNTTTMSPKAQQRSLLSPSTSRSVTVNLAADDSPLPPTTPKTAPVLPNVLSAEEVEGVKQIFEMKLEKVSRDGAVVENSLKQQIEALENNAKRDKETIRILEEKLQTADGKESEMQTKITELETNLQNTIAEKINVEDSNKAVIVNLVAQVGALQSKLTTVTNEKDTVASTLMELEESSKQEIAQRKLRCLELERQLGQVTFMKEETEESLSKAENTIAAQLGQINLLKDDMVKIQVKLAETEVKLEEVTVSEQELAWQNHALSVTGQMYAKNANGTDVSGRSTEYLSQIKALEKEREELRETVNKLSVKLYKVVGFLDEMVQEQEAIITETMTRDSEMVETTALITNVDGSVQSVPASQDRVKLLSNVSGMKEQIIGVIDSVIEGMPEELEDDVVEQVCTTLNQNGDHHVTPPTVVLP